MTRPTNAPYKTENETWIYMKSKRILEKKIPRWVRNSQDNLNCRLRSKNEIHSWWELGSLLHSPFGKYSVYSQLPSIPLFILPLCLCSQRIRLGCVVYGENTALFEALLEQIQKQFFLSLMWSVFANPTLFYFRVGVFFGWQLVGFFFIHKICNCKEVKVCD